MENEINENITKWLIKLARNNETSLRGAKKLLDKRELEEFHWEVDEYIEKAETLAFNKQWAKQLENASANVHITRFEALKINIQNAIEQSYNNLFLNVKNLAETTFEEDYYKSVFEIQKGLNTAWSIAPINQRLIDLIIVKPWAVDGLNFSDRIWKHKTEMVNKLHAELFKMVSLGEGIENASKNLIGFVHSNVKKAKKVAERLILTERAAFSALSKKQMYEELEVEKFKFDATLDKRTSEKCQDMDGSVFDIVDYVVGVTVPPLHPRCRSATVPISGFDTSSDTRVARGDDGGTYSVPAGMKYGEWKEKFVKSKGDKADLLNNKNLHNQVIENDLTNNNKNDTIILDNNDEHVFITGALDPIIHKKRIDEHNARYYESIRKTKADCEKIAKNTSLPLWYVEKAKKHLFLTLHDLGGENLEYFYPDYEIAQSWQRLILGKKIQDCDIILIHHENLESEYMAKGFSQGDAHDKANEVYNYNNALKERGR